ncbi:hypothetical protein K439DRAFT_1633334 [Ramaria rubella]|nr:hypothetical protein K439DRAFT_1633334 [Ramaria rubella]
MSEALVYNIPAWSKDIDPLFACDKTMLFPDQPATDFYSARRMSDSALSADTGTTTTDPDSPATEPDAVSPDIDHLRKPSLPGIGALTPLLDPSDPLSFPRRASLPTLTSDMSLSRSPVPSLSRANFRTRPYEQQLSSYAFPAAENEQSQRPRVDASYSYSPGFGGQHSATSSAGFPSPFASPLSPEYIPRSHSAASLDPNGYPNQLQQWATSPVTEAPASPPRSTPKRRRSPGTPPASAPPAPAPQPDGQPQRRPRGKLPKHTTDLLKEWLHAHSDHPYPSEDEKRDLCARTKLSMSQVSNWMINARRRILAPAKPPAGAATTTEPYRGLNSAPLPRPIGSMYAHPHHMYPPSMVRRVSSEESLRLYDPPYPGQEYGAPRYQTQGAPMYAAAAPDRRLAYPASTIGYGAGDYAQQYTHAPPLFLPNTAQQQRDNTPRYFAAPPDPPL